MYKATINNKSFIINADNGVMVNGELVDWDVAKISDEHFHILYKNKGYRAEFVKTDKGTKTFVIKINNCIYTVSIKDKFDLLLEKMGINNASTQKVNYIVAPMPGLIIELKVNIGDKVKTGDTLLILEAMKMENSIKAPGDGVIKSLKIEQGDIVEKGQVLIEL